MTTGIYRKYIANLHILKLIVSILQEKKRGMTHSISSDFSRKRSLTILIFQVIRMIPHSLTMTMFIFSTYHTYRSSSEDHFSMVKSQRD